MKNRDYEIIQRVLAGDRRAYAALVDAHKDRAMTLTMRMLKNREDAEEALQDAFVRAFRALPRFEWKSNFSTWFYRIVYNVCVTALAKRGDVAASSLNDRDGEGRTIEIPSHEGLPDALYESSEFQKAVSQEIARLSPTYGSILTLFLVQEMSYDEIVEATGLPLGTVKVRLFRARAMIRDALLKRFGEVGKRNNTRAGRLSTKETIV